MSFRTYLRLLRLPSLLLRLWLNTILVTVALGASWYAGLPRGTDAFRWLVLALPMVTGFELARSLQSALRPFRPVFPSPRKVLLKRHVPVVCALALLFGTAGAWADRGVPWVAATGLAALALTLALPLDGAGRWAGSRVLSFALAVLSLGLAVGAATVRSAAQQHPWALAVACLAAAAACCRWSFPREREGAGAARRMVEFGDALTPKTVEVQGRRRLARSKRTGRRWTLTQVRSQFDWVRVVLHEAYGFRFGWQGQVALIPLLCASSYLVGLFVGSHFGPGSHATSFADLVYRSLWVPATLRQPGDPSLVVLLVPFAIVIASAGLPHPRRNYPLSRRRLALLSFATSMVHAAVATLLVAATFLVMAWMAGAVAGVEAPYTRMPAFVAVLLMLVPFLPWVYWMRLYVAVRPQDTSMQALFFLTAALAASLTAMVPRIYAWSLPANWIIGLIVATAASAALYRAALLNFFRHGDLVQRGSARHNLSLV